jgi:hypothetical protein
MTAEWMWWSPPVPVRTNVVGRTYGVSNVKRAIETLDEWGGRKNPKLRRAIDVCSKAMEGLATVEEARAAFEKAAIATDRLMPTG